MTLGYVQTIMLLVVVDLCNEKVDTWVGKVKLQQALVLLSEARFMLEDADWSNRIVGSKCNLSFEKVVLVRVA
jgi:hypothetical protein